MPKPFYHEQLVEVDGEKLLLALNFKAIDATEQLSGRDYDSILEEVQSADCRAGTMGRAVWGLLREHHPEVTIDETMSLLAGKASAKVGIALRLLLEAAFPAVEKAKAPNPRKPRGASKPS
jgi:hypothetical protein